MRSPLPPVALLLALVAPGPALADDGAQITQRAHGPIAGTPIPGTMNDPDPADGGRPKKAWSPGLAIAGGVIAAVGAGGALAGLVLMNSGSGDCAGSLCRQDAARISLLVGAPVLATGLVMTILGLRPSEEPAVARLRPAVAVGPAAASLTWRF